MCSDRKLQIRIVIFMRNDGGHRCHGGVIVRTMMLS